jgi:hypothetical protein
MQHRSLTQKRAKVVTDYLAGVGNVPVRRIIVVVFGGGVAEAVSVSA